MKILLGFGIMYNKFCVERGMSNEMASRYNVPATRQFKNFSIEIIPSETEHRAKFSVRAHLKFSKTENRNNNTANLDTKYSIFGTI